MSKYNYRLIHRNRLLLVAAGAFATVGITGTLLAAQFGDWSVPVSAESGTTDTELNTAFNDGCPILSPDGLSLYMATNRPDETAAPDLNIWVARRATTTSGWGAPVMLPAPINTAANEYCPTPVRGKRLFFVRAPVGTNNGDIYLSREQKDGYDEPTLLGREINDPSQQEWSPSYYEDEAGNEVLYFSRTTSGTAPHSIYRSINFGPAELVPELSAGGDAARPNVRKDGREIVFDSGRGNSLGGQDVWIAQRDSADQPWSPPEHLTVVSGPGNDTRASLSWDGTFLLVGSVGKPGGEGQADIYVSTRSGRNGE